MQQQQAAGKNDDSEARRLAAEAAERKAAEQIQKLAETQRQLLETTQMIAHRQAVANFEREFEANQHRLVAAGQMDRLKKMNEMMSTGSYRQNPYF